MAVGLVSEAPGVTQAQCDQVRNEVLPDNKLLPGMLYYAGGPSESGMCVVTIWESREAVQRFFAERLQPALQRAGISVQPRLFQATDILKS